MSKFTEIEIHAGHWKALNSGANGVLNEVTEARRVGKRVFEILKESKIPVTYFEDNTSTNQSQNLSTLVKHHNQDRNGLVVSIHFNAGGDGSKGIGTEVLYYNQKELAEKVSKAISKSTGSELKNRGSKLRTNLAVLANTYEPAILIEVCFVNSVVDAKIYKRDFEKICQAIAKELAASLGKSLKVATVQKEEGAKEIMQFLNNTARNECKEMILRGVNEKLFTSKHEGVDKYSDVELISYAFAYLNRKNK